MRDFDYRKATNKRKEFSQESRILENEEEIDLSCVIVRNQSNDSDSSYVLCPSQTELTDSTTEVDAHFLKKNVSFDNNEPKSYPSNINKRAKSLVQVGLSIEEVAAILGTKTSFVEKWCSDE